MLYSVSQDSAAALMVKCQHIRHSASFLSTRNGGAEEPRLWGQDHNAWPSASTQTGMCHVNNLYTTWQMSADRVQECYKDRRCRTVTLNPITFELGHRSPELYQGTLPIPSSPPTERTLCHKSAEHWSEKTKLLYFTIQNPLKVISRAQSKPGIWKRSNCQRN